MQTIHAPNAGKAGVEWPGPLNELLTLSLLMHWPLHAYRLAKIANNIIGPEEEISRGTLSALLARLEHDGLITEADPATVPFPSDRIWRVLAITPQGRERFLQLMLATTSSQAAYSKVFQVKAVHLEFLSAEQQLALVDHYLAYCQRLLHAKQAGALEFGRDPIQREQISAAFRTAALDFMRHNSEQWQAEIAWAQSLREHRVCTSRR
jgi:DNA-binding PadR family transcriptional regulator